MYACMSSRALSGLTRSKFLGAIGGKGLKNNYQANGEVQCTQAI